MSLTVNENEYGLTVSETPTHSLTVSGTSGPLTIASDDLSLTVSDTPTSLLTVTSSTDPSITVQDNNILLTIDQSTGSTSSANPFDQDLNTTDSPTFAAITVSGTVDGRDLSVDGTKLDGIAVQANKYVHPTYTSRSINTSGASVLDEFTSDVAGHVTNITTRTLTLADLGYTGATDANNYVLPTSFTARNINTSGAHVLDTFTSDTSGRVTGITTRPLLLADIGYTGATNADVTPSWVPSTNPNYLTAASTDLDSRYYTETELNSFLALKLSRAGGVMTGNITMSGSETVDGRDLSVDGSKLDGISAGADVTPSWVPSTNPNYLTAASTDLDSRYYTETETDQFLNLKANKLSPVFTGTPSAPTAAAGTNTTQLATTAFVGTAVAGLVDSAPTTLDTLNELAAALGDDANFSTTVTNSIATKLPLAGGQMTGNITMSGSETVDGRDLSVDGAKLDDIEEGATADQTASEILTLIKTVDGSGSGLDADTLDGISSASFLRSDADDTMSGNLTIAKTDPTITLFDNSGANTDPNGTIIFSEASGTTNFDINYNGSDDRLEFRGRIGSTLTDLIYINRSSGNVINVYGNIIVTGTVDGRDVASDGSKLDGISAGADVTPSWVPSTNPNYLTASSTDLDSRYYTETETDQLLALKAPLASPAFTGTPTAPTPSLSDDNTNIATTEYVKGQSYLTSVTASDVGLGNVTNESKATMFASPAFTGTPTAPTPSLSDNNTTIATTEYVKGQNYLTAVSTDLDSRYYTETETDQFLALKAPLASPTFTGTPTAPTPSLSDNNTTIATTEYVKGQNYLTAVSTDLDSRYYTETETDQFLALKAPLASPTFTGTPTAPTPSLSDNNTNIATTEYVKGQNYLTAVSTDLDSRYYTETEINQFLNLKLNKSGGTMTGSIDMGTNDITNAGEIEANEFIGNLRGAVSFTAKAGEALTKGDVVYISGISGNLTVVAKADADNDSKMPAFGVASETVSINANVTIINFGRVSNLDTSGFSEGDELFVSNTAGVLSSTAPSGESSALQKMAKVTRSHASAGSITVMGAGRTNAVPNLNEGRLFVGNSSNKAVADGTVHVDIANSRVGIGTTTPQTPLHVQDSAGSGIRVSRSGSSAYAQLFPAYSSVPTLMGRGAGGLHLGYESNTAGIRIDTSNNVGIGTTSPNANLHVYNTGNGEIEVERASGALINIQAQSAKGVIGTDSNHSLALKTNGSQRLTILNTGDVGIGTGSPSELLEVSSNTGAAGGTTNPTTIRISDTGNGSAWDTSNSFANLDFYSADSSGSGAGTKARVGAIAENSTGAKIGLAFSTTNTTDGISEKLRIDCTGNVGIGTTNPLQKLHVVGNTTTTGVSYTDIVQTYSGSSIDFRHQDASVVMRVDTTNARVGIGTTSPAQRLSVEGGSVLLNSPSEHQRLFIVSSSSYQSIIYFGDSDSNTRGRVAYNNTNDSLYFNTNGSTKMTLLSGGNVGIGTGSPAHKLDVNGGIRANGNIVTTSASQIIASRKFSALNTSGVMLTDSGASNGLSIANGGNATFTHNLDVTGDLSADNITSISNGGSASIYINSTRPTLGFTDSNSFTDPNDIYIIRASGGNKIQFQWYDNSAATTTETFSIDKTGDANFAGDVVVSGNLTVNGTTTTINSTTVQVDDKNIELGTVATPTDTTADGGGITLKGATDKTINWVNSTSSWTSNQTFSAPNLTLTNLSSYSGSEVTALMIDGSNIVGKRALGTNAFNSTSFLPLAGGTITGNVRFNDSIKAEFGSSADLQINHDGTQSLIDNGTGNLTIQNQTNDGDIIFKSDDGSGGITPYMYLDGSYVGTRFPQNVQLDDNVELRLGTNQDLRLEHTGSNGTITNYTGNLTISNTTDDGDVIFQSDDGSGGITPYLTLDGSSTGLTVSAPQGMVFFDSIKAKFGNNDDLQIYHNGSHSYIHNDTGNIYIENDTTDGDIFFKSDDGSGGLATYLKLDGGTTTLQAYKDLLIANDTAQLKFGASQDFKLYHNGSNSYVVNNTGDLEIINNTDDGDIKFVSDDGSGGTATYFSVDGGAARINFFKNTKYSDNVKALFGFGSDLQIYHDGTHSYLTNNVTGSLYIQSANSIQLESSTGEDMITAAANGAVSLYYDNSKKLETTTSGVSVTGSMVAHAAVVNQVTAATSSGSIKFKNNSGSDKAIILDNGNFGIGTTSPATPLHLYSAEAQINFESSHGRTSSIYQGGGNFHIRASHSSGVAINYGSSNTALLNLYNNTTPAVSFNANGFSYFNGGNVGIGVGDPDSKLEIKGSGTGSGVALRVRNASNTELLQVTDEGIVKVTSHYFYAASSHGAYIQGHLRCRGGISNDQGTLSITGDVSFDSYTLYVDSAYDRVGVGSSSPSYKLDVSGGIRAGGKVTYQKSAASLDTTGYAVAGLTSSYNGDSAGFTFTCYGHTGGYQRIVYACHNVSGTTWNTQKVIDEGTNDFDVAASANGSTITFTFKSRSGTKSYTPRVVVEAAGGSVNNTYA